MVWDHYEYNVTFSNGQAIFNSEKEQTILSFLCVLPLFMDRFWEISFHWGDWWTIRVCTHRPTGDTLGKTAFWNVLCYTSVTLESCSLKVFWSKMVDWLLKVIRWYHDCEILFPIRLAIMFLLWDCSKLHGVQIFWMRHWSGKKPSKQRTLMIFLSFYNDVLYNGRMIAWLSVLWRESAGCWFLGVLASHKEFLKWVTFPSLWQSDGEGWCAETFSTLVIYVSQYCCSESPSTGSEHAALAVGLCPQRAFVFEWYFRGL